VDRLNCRGPGRTCQAFTRAELLQFLRIALTETLEFGREEARSTAGAEYEEVPIAVGSVATLG
jgi:hypothetical protein